MQMTTGARHLQSHRTKGSLNAEVEDSSLDSFNLFPGIRLLSWVITWIYGSPWYGNLPEVMHYNFPKKKSHVLWDLQRFAAEGARHSDKRAVVPVSAVSAPAFPRQAVTLHINEMHACHPLIWEVAVTMGGHHSGAHKADSMAVPASLWALRFALLTA